MLNALKIIAALSVWLIMITGVHGDESRPPREGGVLPEIVLTVPASPEHQEYLGLAGKKTFQIPDIQADVVIIEIFSMY